MQDNLYSYSAGIIGNSAMFFCAGIAFLYGVANFFKRKKPLFAQLVTCALGCFALLHLFSIVNLVCTRELPTGMNSGIFGLISAFMFLFCASFGQMDGLADDKSKKMLKYRLISLAAPILILVMCVLVVTRETLIYMKVLTALQYFMFAGAAYYNLKHLIIPDVDLGIIKAIRGYNLLALLIDFAYALIFIGDKLSIPILSASCGIIISLLYLVIIPIMKKGVKKWLI